MNIFNISRELEDIFYQIEENGGEITPELEEKLAISEENLRDKLDGYRRVHSKLMSDAKTCKEEETRIAKLRKTKENQAERLKDTMLAAVQQFGALGKSGNRLINLPDAKLYTKVSACTELDNNRSSILMQLFLDIYQTSWASDTLEEEFGSIADERLLQMINEKFKEHYNLINSGLATEDCPEEFIPFTMDDLDNFKINFSFSYSIKELNNITKFTLLKAWYDNAYCTSNFIQGDANKTEIKNKIKDGADITIARVVEHDNLIVK